ncbi:MAG: hypothetical protein HON51_08815 [Gammaproteobacteria bacterium]|jgi:hypothetical protein|nr:hypothetical protein [Gammaproteobacteria bacterium]MBT5824851.1 hypothetical protein [Gammaproteobacteria bacterium]MBT6419969.1 hypothetical protein [Gammaproteobacteria bacterium]MBT6576308.1 hypothetical protein [Gammaproteobacteria bacterium]MBT7434766.1 hypothetical protein [Gammaproteobacteria bacterium]
MAFANKLFQGKRGKGTGLTDKKRVRIRMAILIGLAIELEMLTASNADCEGSVFRKFAPLFNLAPSSVQNNYYRHKPWIVPIVEAILQYHDDKNSVQQEAWPSLQRHIDDLEAAIHLIIPNRLK